jgi:DNA-binding CsgD family transcriptional regulator
VRGRLARWLLLRSQSVHAQAQARFADARRLATEADGTAAPLGQPNAPIVWSGFLSTTAHHVGHDDESLASQVFPEPEQLDVPTAGVIRALAPALVLADIGRLQQAAAIYRSLGPVGEWQPSPHATLFTYAFGIRLAMRLGADDDVALLHGRLAPYRGHHVVSGVCSIAYFGPVELWLGVAAAHLDLLDDAVADLEHAAKACAVSGAAGFQAEAQYELGRVLARRARPGDLARGRRLVAEAARQAEALGMPPIAERAAQLLSQIDQASAELPLTPREREVAELVAQGLTNRQIADRLFLSERTAQNHVQHILDKLDLPNRSQIAVLIASGR